MRIKVASLGLLELLLELGLFGFKMYKLEYIGLIKFLGCWH